VAPRYQPMGRIDAVVLSARMGSLIACLDECQIELPPSCRRFSGLNFERLARSVDAERIDAQNLRGDIRSESSGQTYRRSHTSFGRNGRI